MKTIVVAGNKRMTQTWVHFFKNKYEAKLYLEMKATAESINNKCKVLVDNEYHYSISFISRYEFKEGVSLDKQTISTMTVYFNVFPTLGNETEEQVNECDHDDCNPVGIILK